MHTANTTTLYSTVIQWKEAIKGKKKKCNFKRRDVSACSRTVSAHLSTDGNCQTCTVC